TDSQEELLREVDPVDSYDSNPLRLKGNWAWSITHFDWLKVVYRLLYLFWVLIGVFGTAAYFWDC
ncbi:unnamed protein product, partial [marine sediment metagenome]